MVEEISLIGTRKFTLIPIGNIRFTWKENSRMKTATPVYFGDVSTSDSLKLTEEDMNRFVKMMRKYKTDLFTDGFRFFGRFGNGIGEVKHPIFEKVKEDSKPQIRYFLYGEKIPK